MLVGFALIPPTAVLFTLVTYDLMFQTRLLPQGAPMDSLDSAESLAAGVGILAVVMTLLGAVPGVISLIHRRSLSLARLLILGAALGNVPFALIVLGVIALHAVRGTLSADIARYWYGLSGAAVRVAMGLITGTGSAAAFWFIIGTRDASGQFADRA